MSGGQNRENLNVKSYSSNSKYNEKIGNDHVGNFDAVRLQRR